MIAAPRLLARGHVGVTRAIGGGGTALLAPGHAVGSDRYFSPHHVCDRNHSSEPGRASSQPLTGLPGGTAQTTMESEMASAAELVESGQSYTIIHIDGRQPESLDDFTGDVHLTLARNDQHLHVTGAIARTADSVRFY
jgi:hypothetical protein